MIQRPQYLEMPIETLKLGPNGVPIPPPTDQPPAGASPAPADLFETDPAAVIEAAKTAKRKPLAFRMDSSVAPETTDALFQAIDKVYHLLKSRRAYHLAEIAKIDAALSPFAKMAAENDSGSPANPSAAIESLIAAVKNLPEAT